MILISPLLLAISTNIVTLSVFLSYGIKKIHLSKSNSILLAIVTSASTFVSMYIGKLILPLIDPKVSNIFGAILLSYIGISFIVENIRLEKKRLGYDTSFYYESSFKYKNLLVDPYILNLDNSHNINLRKCLALSISLSVNNICTNFSASITGVNLSISVFLNFIISILFVYIGYFNRNINFSKYLIRYSNFISGIVLIAFGIYEIFV
ncbi:manganese efflux pump [Clostridium beijerinckii]|uniref:Sporulation protein YtaF n=2 Tax=Clostridium beijerinckii TaxID=1520 RepID=A0A9Q5D5X5_CLOBE|nr:manganese efflux pump [Clostridium beijerinckii]AQS04430.1 manganese efflux pump MntP [Clostridium beijerinckii]MBA2887982.1 putative sporulation protein YtaF [Clostridium beijerinckii]MBA2902715.1 putative sporulation protein YtaF [Clostridium beijerinckii]MBA2912545.1 putative sporulation protein YtaF [Clostridium beijerinckii]MBA9016015.1 putative sporulation protein YtaF [Clostridium beijerinckii]